MLIEHLLGCSEHLHLLATSRREQDFVEELERIMDVQVDLSQGWGIAMDINLYVTRSLENDLRLRKWNSRIKEEILKALVEGAHGM